MGHHFYIYSSIIHHFAAISVFKIELQLGNAHIGSNLIFICPLWLLNFSDGEALKLGQIWRFFASCDFEILRMTLKINRTPLLCPSKLYVSFRSHRWIPISGTFRKQTSWVLTSVALTFDLWSRAFVWTSLLSMVITPKNFMMIRWQEHREKGVTDGRTDRQTDEQTDKTIHRAAWSQLKMKS